MTPMNETQSVDAAAMLAECPFCGDEAILQEVGPTHLDDDQWNVGCNNPDCACVGGTRGTPEKAVEVWNARAAATSPALPQGADIDVIDAAFQRIMSDQTQKGSVREIRRRALCAALAQAVPQDAGWHEAIEAAAGVAKAITEKHFNRALDLYKKEGEGKAIAASDAAEEVELAIRALTRPTPSAELERT